MVNDGDTKPPPIKVGLTYNLKRDNAKEDEAEFDSIETVNAIKRALEETGCDVILLEADRELPNKISEKKPDIVFNIAEGKNGRAREAHVPSILSYYGVPFTGSDETTLCICLDKALAKRMLISHKIKTPRYQLISGADYKLSRNLDFPLIAKPNSEGSSKGISDVSVVNTAEELKKLTDKVFKKQGAEILLEEYVTGREFTVGIIGNNEETKVFSPMEIVFKPSGKKYNVYDYDIKKDCMKYVEYVCPAHLDKAVEKKIKDTAKKTYDSLECRDFARIDFILTEYNELYCIEINPLAGLTPGYSDFPMLADANGVTYNELIGMILSSALKRYKMEGL